MQPPSLCYTLKVMAFSLEHINVIGECGRNRLGLWECPPFLFIIMGIVNIFTVTALYVFASRLIYEPEVAALIVLAVSVLIFIIGNFLIAGFNKIAEANRIKSEFLNLVSHQLRTPLSVFKWTVELLEHERSGSKYLPLLAEHSERMIRIVNLLLDVSRIEARRFTLHREPVSLEQLTAEAVRALQTYADTSGVEISFEARSRARVFGDVERLRMVIQNLIDNAIRYSSSNGQISIALSDQNHSFVEWRIADQGLGIPRLQQKYIFQKFFRAGNGQAHEPHGTGLGLYIAKAIITDLRGEIGFESQEGKGSTFWFKLPIYDKS